MLVRNVTFKPNVYFLPTSLELWWLRKMQIYLCMKCQRNCIISIELKLLHVFFCVYELTFKNKVIEQAYFYNQSNNVYVS